MAGSAARKAKLKMVQKMEYWNHTTSMKFVKKT
jgi:hypothetical protein